MQRNGDSRKILVVDDQEDVRQALRLLLKSSGYLSEEVGTPSAALASCAYGDHDLIVADMNYTWDTTSGSEGLWLLDQLHSRRPHTPVIAMTGWSTIELAVAAMHHGARDFVPKPWDNRHLLEIIRKHIDARPTDRQPMDAELAIARKVQRTLFPAPFFSMCGLECECASLAAGEVSGDLYDFIAVDSDSMAFVLGDVCGKGIGAALLVANLQACLRSLQDMARDPAKLMDRVNRLFFESTRPEHFATLFYGVYNSRRRRLDYVNCGHPSPVLLRGDDSTHLLQPTATVLGAFKERGFQSEAVEVATDDQLFVFSDGFSEANLSEANAEEEDGNWPLQTIRQVGSKRQKGAAGKLANEAAAWGPIRDDITVMHLRRTDATTMCN
jgi:sigma-B regulation protein RsbU (phosphoserine phosphatase)